jgi:TolB-like protein/Tfp pilus assembly protein PilF
MKHCPECNKNYADPTISYCLEDGSSLIFGPAVEEPETAIISGEPTDEAATRTFEPTRPSEEDNVPNRRPIAIGIVILFLAALGISSYLYFGRGAAKQIESIAVLPFQNVGGDPDIEYLSDGITESLISTLSQLSGLSVKAPSSVFRYKGRDVSAQTVGSELNVQAVLNGRVVHRGDDLTLYLSLVDAKTENQIWGKQYTRKANNLVTLQTELAQDVAKSVQAKLSGTEQDQLGKTYTANPEAYQLYLQGRFHWNKRTPEGSDKAIEYFRRAIELDPNYALAYVGLADAYSGYIVRDRSYSKENLLKGRPFAEKALQLDDQLGEAHASLGYILLSDYDFRGAEREFKRAIELNPNYSLAHSPYGILLRNAGRFDEAIAESRRAVELEPLFPHMINSYASTFLAARRWDEAIQQFQRALDLEPNNVAALAGMGRAYTAKGDYATAVEYFAKNSEAAGFSELAKSMRTAFASEGWPGYLRVFVKEGERVQFSRFNIAPAYLALGDKDKAFSELNRSFELREPPLAGIKVDFRFDALRDDPRYKELLNKIGLPES